LSHSSSPAVNIFDKIQLSICPFKNYAIRWVRWYTSVIPVRRRQSQEAHKFEASLGYIVRLYPRRQKQPKTYTLQPFGGGREIEDLCPGLVQETVIETLSQNKPVCQAPVAHA
jgi:hypothetical protein